MKIIFVNRFYSPDHSATSQMLTDLAIALAAGGVDVHIVTSRQRYDDPQAALPPHERQDGVEVHRVWTSAFGRGNLPGRAFDYLREPGSACGLGAAVARGRGLRAKRVHDRGTAVSRLERQHGGTLPKLFNRRN